MFIAHAPNFYQRILRGNTHRPFSIPDRRETCSSSDHKNWNQEMKIKIAFTRETEPDLVSPKDIYVAIMKD